MFCQDQKVGKQPGIILLHPAELATPIKDPKLKAQNQPAKPTFAHLLNGHKLNKDDFPDKVWADYIF